MPAYRVWADTKSESCLLLAESEGDAIDCISLMAIYGDRPLNAVRDSDNWDLPHDFVVLPTGGTVQKPGLK